MNSHVFVYSRSELAEELAVAMNRKKELKELLRKFESQIEGVHGRSVMIHK